MEIAIPGPALTAALSIKTIARRDVTPGVLLMLALTLDPLRHRGFPWDIFIFVLGQNSIFVLLWPLIRWFRCLSRIVENCGLLLFARDFPLHLFIFMIFVLLHLKIRRSAKQ